MADELAQAEETAQVETPTETPELSETTPQAAETPSVPEAPAEPDRGDPRIAMQEERRKRQELEARLNDANYVYELAKRHGLAQEETPSFAPEQNPLPAQRGPDVSSIVESQLEYRDLVREHPEFDRDKGDAGLVKWAATLVSEGHGVREAADIVLRTMDKYASASAGRKVEEALRSRAQSEGLKMSADAIVSTASPSGTDAETEAILAAAKDWRHPREQQAAIIEKMKRGI